MVTFYQMADNDFDQDYNSGSSIGMDDDTDTSTTGADGSDSMATDRR
ncbi:MAG: hypothetical protein M3Q81_02325 [bacterium]|nr:hypothetical protein [bacterium]